MEVTDNKITGLIKKLKQTLHPGIKYSLILSAIVNLSMLTIGCLNLHDCPIDRRIPVFLIATGALGLTSKIVSLTREKISIYLPVAYIESALYGAELVLFFLGTYWVYKNFQPSYNPKDQTYCNKTAYIFAFSYITVFYVIFVAMLSGFCCFICCAICLAKQSTETSDPAVIPTRREEVSHLSV